MGKVVNLYKHDFDAIARTMTDEQIAQTLVLTKKKMNQQKILTLITGFCVIGIFLPCGKMAQLYTVGYATLRGKKAPFAWIWAFFCLPMSLIYGLLARFDRSIVASRVVVPDDVKL